MDGSWLPALITAVGMVVVAVVTARTGKVTKTLRNENSDQHEAVVTALKATTHSVSLLGTLVQDTRDDVQTLRLDVDVLKRVSQ